MGLERAQTTPGLEGGSGRNSGAGGESFVLPLARVTLTRLAFIIVQTNIDMLVLFSQPRGILVDNLTMTSDLADTLIREPGVR